MKAFILCIVFTIWSNVALANSDTPFVTLRFTDNNRPDYESLLSSASKMALDAKSSVFFDIHIVNPFAKSKNDFSTIDERSNIIKQDIQHVLSKSGVNIDRIRFIKEAKKKQTYTKVDIFVY